MQKVLAMVILGIVMTLTVGAAWAHAGASLAGATPGTTSDQPWLERSHDLV